jgi:DNA-binding NarL/FixJ family response regulator
MGKTMSTLAAEASISVLIVEDDAATRSLLAAAIASEPTLRLAAALCSVKEALAWLRTGHADMLLTDLGFSDGSGIDVIRACLRRCPGCDVLARLRSGRAPGAANDATLLTKRESDILGLIARGDSYGDIAQELSVSVGTVQTHVKNLYGKLSVHSRGAAVFEAHRRGLLQMHALKARA